MGAFVVPPVCARCGSYDVTWVGETRASVFVRCNRCLDVWRLDPILDRERIVPAHPAREPVPATSNAGRW